MKITLITTNPRHVSRQYLLFFPAVSFSSENHPASCTILGVVTVTLYPYQGSFNRTSSGGHKSRHFRLLDIWRKWTADSHRTGSTPKKQPLLLGALTTDSSRSQSQWENGKDAGCSTDQVGKDELCRVSSGGRP
ncbi:hypothetical protein HNY73_014106 [Argiope bruennichi]|uniref:Uncharacterized protein n=1 Tax=Argiope bruennichi TaxID=94029 RepID=A0A8T0ES68_ARGBR|nr:hypothetical protein HNY73_014106 [Argiope bruennichi]